MLLVLSAPPVFLHPHSCVCLSTTCDNYDCLYHSNDFQGTAERRGATFKKLLPVVWIRLGVTRSILTRSIATRSTLMRSTSTCRVDKTKHDCVLCVRQQSPSPGHPSTADEVCVLIKQEFDQTVLHVSCGLRTTLNMEPFIESCGHL